MKRLFVLASTLSGYLLVAPAADALPLEFTADSAGSCTSASGRCDWSGKRSVTVANDVRNWFAFELEADDFAFQAGTALSAFLTIGEDAGTYTGMVDVDDVVFNLYGVERAVVAAAEDRDSTFGTEGLFVFDELINGPVIGSATIATPGDEGDMPEVVVFLNPAGLGILNGLPQNGNFSFGGWIEDLPEGASLWVDSGSDPTLSITPIPLPAAAWLLLAASGGLIAAKRRHARRAA